MKVLEARILVYYTSSRFGWSVGVASICLFVIHLLAVDNIFTMGILTTDNTFIMLNLVLLSIAILAILFYISSFLQIKKAFYENPRRSAIITEVKPYNSMKGFVIFERYRIIRYQVASVRLNYEMCLPSEWFRLAGKLRPGDTISVFYYRKRALIDFISTRKRKEEAEQAKGSTGGIGSDLDKILSIKRICKSGPSERPLEAIFGGKKSF